MPNVHLSARIPEDVLITNPAAGDVPAPEGFVVLGLRVLAGGGDLVVETHAGNVRTLPVQEGDEIPLGLRRLVAAGTDASLTQVLLYLAKVP